MILRARFTPCFFIFTRPMKKPAENLPRVSLTEEERAHLMVIYNARLRNLVFVYAFLIATGMYASLVSFRHRSDDRDEYRVFGHEVTPMEMFYGSIVLIQGLLIWSGVRMFKKRVYAYKKDAMNGEKEVKTYTVTNKLYFQHTGEFYLSFDDPNYMHYKVDPDIYATYNIGDQVPVYRGVYSKYVFEKDARFTFM